MPDFNTISLNKSFSNKRYQTKLDNDTKKIFGEQDKIDKDELMKNTDIFNIVKKLSKRAQYNFESVLNLDGDINTITKNEYKTLLILLDAKWINSKFTYLVDGDYTQSRKSAIRITNDLEIDHIYNKIKSIENSKK